MSGGTVVPRHECPGGHFFQGDSHASDTGFKPSITLGRSNQIASNSVCRYRGPIPIDLLCSLIFMPFVTEIQLNKLRALFPA